MVNQPPAQQFERIFRTESRFALATLCRLLGDIDLAEDSLQEAMVLALQKWPTEGTPANPRAWLISTARFKAIDRLRRHKRLGEAPSENLPDPTQEISDADGIEDDMLRLIFMCCHPVLTMEAQVALTLREVCGLSTGEVAKAFLLSEPTLAQRIVRAKAKLKQSNVPFEVPGSSELPERLASVLRVVYLVFNEGYYASSGASLTSAEISGEALRVGDLLCQLLPEPEVFGLAALMNFAESRRDTRTQDGDIVLLEDQDRARWDRQRIHIANEYLAKATDGRRGSYALQAAIAAEHANAPSSADTNWWRIVDLYNELDQLWPSPVVKLNRAVAAALGCDLPTGLEEIETLIAGGGLQDYGLAHSARADLLSRVGRYSEAKEAYEKALDLAQQEPEKRFLRRRIEQIEKNL